MKKSDKAETVATLAEKLAASPNLYLTDFTGITVKNMTDLRRRFRAEGAEFVVVKNTLAVRAFEAAAVTGLTDVLTGPTAIVLAGHDPVAAARVLADFRKEQEDRPAIKAGVVDGKPVGEGEIKKLASLPTRDVLLAQLGAAFQSPMAGFVGVLDSLLYQFVGSLEALRAQRDNAS